MNRIRDILLEMSVVDGLRMKVVKTCPSDGKRRLYIYNCMIDKNSLTLWQDITTEIEISDTVSISGYQLQLQSSSPMSRDAVRFLAHVPIDGFVIDLYRRHISRRRKRRILKSMEGVDRLYT